VKLKELPYLLGIRPAPKTYAHEIQRFELSKDGTVEYAQWLHPQETRKEITQASVDELRTFLSPGDVAIDIGAHTGDSTLPIALAVGKQGCVLALEPNRYVFPILKKNSELNPKKTNIIPLMFAATPEDEEVEFRYSDSGYCNGARFEGVSQWSHGHAFKLKVQGRNLVSFLRATYPLLFPRIRYVKIDTEGYEPVVIRSLSSLLSQRKPYLKVEVYRRLSAPERIALHRDLARHGYVIHKIADDGRYCGEILGENDLNRWTHFDIFCVPSP
jgi:FkbM family methyltransferase